MADYIDRHAAIDYYCTEVCTSSEGCPCRAYPCLDISWINELPSAEVEPVKMGRWIVHTDKFANGAEYFGYAVCSECGDMFNCMETIGLKPIWDYCPNCGARMNTEAEEDEE